MRILVELQINLYLIARKKYLLKILNKNKSKKWIKANSSLILKLNSKCKSNEESKHQKHIMNPIFNNNWKNYSILD